MPDHDLDPSRPADDRSVAPVELWEVNEQLLLAGLREHALASQLQRQLAFSRTIAASLAEGVCAIDRAGQITFVNAAAEQMLGWLDAELRGREAATLLQGPDAARNRTPVPLADVLRTGATSRNEQTLFMRKDGTTFPVAYSVAPIIADEQVVGAVVAFNDVTDVQRLQQAQEDYLALLSHDLRAPLATILGYAELLLEQLKAQAMERATLSATGIVRSGAAMERLIQDVLDRSRQQLDRGELHLTSIDLVQLVTRSIEENLLPAERARITVEAAGPLTVVADAIRLERVIINLLTNACAYSAAADPVVVRVSTTGRDALITVTDQGGGIAAADLAHLFERHYRAGPAWTRPGSGLGLYGSRLIVEAHGGRIWAQSAVGTGSTFLVSLPISEP